MYLEAVRTTAADETVDAIRSFATLSASGPAHPATHAAGGQYVEMMPIRD